MRFSLAVWIGAAALVLGGCGGGGGGGGGGDTTHALAVTKAGTSTGTVTSSAGGIDCGATCDAMLDTGTSVTLSAAADEGAVFAGWTGGCTGHAPTCVVAVSADTTVTATFDLDSDTGKPRFMYSSDFPPLDTIPGGIAGGCSPAAKCSDTDDLQSMVRLLLYTNELDVEGLIASAGTFANIANKQNIVDMVNLYGQVEANLKLHDEAYPTAAYLTSVTYQGRDGTWGGAATALLGEGRDSEASEAVIAAVDKDDPRPLWICFAGGTREVAQALWKVQATRTPDQLRAFIGKLRLYAIARQDGTTKWMEDNFPDLFLIVSTNNYMGQFWNAGGSDASIANLAWINANIRENHGPLGAAYPQSGYYPEQPGQWEGDTPSFLYLISAVRGVSDRNEPEMGSWGGKFVRTGATNHFTDDRTAGARSVWQYRPAVNAEFAERADWMLPPVQP